MLVRILVGAGLFVLGDVVEAGGHLQITAGLYRTDDWGEAVVVASAEGDDTFVLEPGALAGSSADILIDAGGSDTVDFRFATAGIVIDMDLCDTAQDVMQTVAGDQLVTLNHDVPGGQRSDSIAVLRIDPDGRRSFERFAE